MTGKKALSILSEDSTDFTAEEDFEPMLILS
jgi:hypothetical protein